MEFNKEQFKTSLTDALYAGTGLLTSDLTGEVITRKAKIAGSKKYLAKIAVKLVFGLGALFAGATVAGGVAGPFAYTFAVGSFAGIFVDLLHMAIPGGLAAVATSIAGKLNEAENAETIVVQAEKPEEIKELVRWP